VLAELVDSVPEGRHAGLPLGLPGAVQLALHEHLRLLRRPLDLRVPAHASTFSLSAIVTEMITNS
jgi:hypothetical protein